MQCHVFPASRGLETCDPSVVIPRWAAALTVLVSVSIPAAAAGPTFTSGPITVERPWSRATPNGADVAVGYLTIRNTSDGPERLVSASSAIAGRVGPHSMVMTDGIMRMRPLPDGVAIPPHGSAVLAPSGDHLMFEALKRPLKAGQQFSATLDFEHAGAVPVTFTVEAIGAKSPDGTPPQGGMNMKMN